MALKFIGERTTGALNGMRDGFVKDDLYRVYDAGILMPGGVSVNHGDFVSWDGTKWKLEADIKIARSDEITDTNSNFAPNYTKKTYEANSYVMQGGVLYTNPNATGTVEDWNPAHWTQTTVAEMMAGAGGSTGYVQRDVTVGRVDAAHPVTGVTNRSVTIASTSLGLDIDPWKITIDDDCTDAVIILKRIGYDIRPSAIDIKRVNGSPLTLYGAKGQMVSATVEDSGCDYDVTPFFNGIGRNPCAEVIIRICGDIALLSFTVA